MSEAVVMAWRQPSRPTRETAEQSESVRQQIAEVQAVVTRVSVLAERLTYVANQCERKNAKGGDGDGC